MLCRAESVTGVVCCGIQPNRILKTVKTLGCECLSLLGSCFFGEQLISGKTVASLQWSHPFFLGYILKLSNILGHSVGCLWLKSRSTL